jgi:hypothetical protein
MTVYTVCFFLNHDKVLDKYYILLQYKEKAKKYGKLTKVYSTLTIAVKNGQNCPTYYITNVNNIQKVLYTQWKLVSAIFH